MASTIARTRPRPRRGGTGLLLDLQVDPSGAGPIYLQVYHQIRLAITSSRLPPGAALPATRSLAAQLQVGRSTIIQAYGLLRAEGYLAARQGASTRIASHPPDLGTAPASGPRPPLRRQEGPGLSTRGRSIRAEADLVGPIERPPRPFRVGMPAVDQFPAALWERLCSRAVRSMPAAMMAYGDPAGYRPLREAVAAFIGASRSVWCAPEQVIITAGSQQAFSLVADLTTDPGDRVWLEDPGYYALRGALRAAGLELVHVPVDESGLDVAAARRLAPDARLAVVTPACQMPLGARLSPVRRRELLAWARARGAWVLEDDYAGDFRFGGQASPTLLSVDHGEHVLYTGTFTKSLFPSIRLGYVIVPPDLVEAFRRARLYADFHPPYLEQAVLAAMLQEGHFDRHVRRVRAVYRERRELLVERMRERLGDLVRVDVPEAARHVLVWLPSAWSDQVVSAAVAAAGVENVPLSFFCARVSMPPALVLGYSGLRDVEIREGVDQLAQVLARAGPAQRAGG